MSDGPLRRRALLLALLTGVAACAQPEPPAPVVTTPAEPEPERVYAPGAIAWSDLSDDHKRRARQGLTRLGEDVPDDETLQARWMTLPPAQQRYLIRRPPPPAPARRPAAQRGRTPARGHAPARTTTPARRTTTPPARRPQQRQQ
ncbi:hypothetical protein [Neoroseomonas soli]|uniref:DUF3106 domain-containing protein n=1 Tax=Neoroseomonas soli TaxID=1081025 RepID=A0A9X9X097_9PROT|nr:hypothetical protein [Neoroseomonas soli]MBR0672826.1 hypothetical protein [Neoroseomonas soli]